MAAVTTVPSQVERLSQKFTKNPIEEYKLQEKITNEEYKIWKKTVPLLYETIQVHVLPHPSGIFQWVPGSVDINKDQNSVTAKFLLSGAKGSGAGDSDYSVLQVGSVELPSTLSLLTSNTIPIPSGPSTRSKFSILHEFKHEDSINSVRINKHNKRVASFLNSGEIAVYDFLNDPENLSAEKLKYHSKKGRALEWAPRGHSQTNTLASGCDDGSIAVWDAQASREPVRTYESAHAAAVTDVSWNLVYPPLLASVSDDASLQIRDLREHDHTRGVPIYAVENAHSGAINAVEFHPSAGTLVATGSADTLVSLWDLRYFQRPFRSLFGISGAVKGLQFDEAQANMLASTAADKRVYLWDLNEIDAGDFDDEIYAKDPENEDPCLKFIHGGHIAPVNDIDRSGELFNVYGSVGSDSLLEIWKPYFIQEEDEEEETVEMEENDEEKKREKRGDEMTETKKQEEGKEDAVEKIEVDEKEDKKEYKPEEKEKEEKEEEGKEEEGKEEEGKEEEGKEEEGKEEEMEESHTVQVDGAQVSKSENAEAAKEVGDEVMKD